MFEIVKTRKQQRAFENTWVFFCKKYSWYNDPYAENGIRYNLKYPTSDFYKPKKVIGTIEFVPYDPTNPNSTVEGPGKFEFSKYPEIIRHQERTWEIDKLCLKEEYQRQGHFQIFVQIFHHHIIENNPKYYLALIEKKFYRMLRITLGVSLEQKGEALVGPSTELIPIVIDIEKMMGNQETVMKLFGTNPTKPVQFRKEKKLSVLYHKLINWKF